MFIPSGKEGPTEKRSAPGQNDATGGSSHKENGEFALEKGGEKVF